MRLAPLAQGRPSPVITALAMDPSGQYAAAAGDDHGLRWFALHGSNQPYVNATLLDSHRDWVQAVEISANGKWLASCAKDGTLQVWRRDVRPSEGSISAADASASAWEKVNSQRVEHALFTIKFIGEHSLIAAGFSNSIYRLDLDRMKWSVDHTCECSDIRALAISSDQRSLAYGGRDGAVRLIDLDRVPAVMDQQRECVMEVQAHTNRIRAMVFSADDSLIYSVAEDRRLVGIDRKSESIQYQLDVGAGRLMAIERLSDERYAVSGSDNTIRLVQPAKSLGGGRTFQVSNVVPDGTVAAKEIALPKAGKLAGRCKLIGHDGTIAVLRSHGDYLFSGSFDTTIRSWNISDALILLDDEGRFIHPVSAQFENSGAQERIR
jgi:WD40 repeat protein